MIIIFPFSLMSLIIALIVKYYLVINKRKIKMSLNMHFNVSQQPTIYFIIKSAHLTSNKMYSYLDEIRNHSERANIIIIGSHIQYDDLFKNHYRIFDVIDMTKNKSLKNVSNKIRLQLDSIYD